MKLISLAAFSAAFLFAQNAQISGVVRDSSNAVIPNAAISLVNQDTASKRDSRTDAVGFYAIPGLSAGRYRLVASADGFQSTTRDQVTLEVAQSAQLDLVLAVGKTEQSVTIVADASQINTADGAVGMTVAQQMVENLPLNGRTFQQLITLAAGVNLSSDSSSAGQFTVNGQRATANYFTVDGVSANIGVTGSTGGSSSSIAGGTGLGNNAAGGTNSLVSVDAVQEFRILTSSYAAEYGRTPGGQVIFLTKSGGNAFHGTLFEYFRNDKLDASNWFANQQGQQKAALRVNNFGGTVGGPVIRNKTFFFFSQEDQRLRQPLFSISTVPDVASRQSAAAATKVILNAFPIPNGAALPNQQAIFAAGFSNPLTTDATSIRLDQVFGTRLTAFGRYSYAPSQSQSRPGQSGNSLSTILTRPTNSQTLTTGATYVISNRMVDELRLNFSDNRFSQSYDEDTLGGAVPLPSSLLGDPFPANNTVLGIQLGFAGGTLFRGAIAGNEQRQVNLTNSVAYTIGSHQLKFGVDYRRLFPLSPNQYRLQYSFAGVPAVISNLASSVQVAFQTGVSGDITNLSSYAQDQWRATSRLTLTYGIRWEINPPPSNRNPNNGNYVPLVGDFNNPATVQVGKVGSPLYNTSHRNFAPRIGVAYQLRQQQGWETVLRGGTGLFYDLGNGAAAINPWTQGFPGRLTLTLSRVAFPVPPGQATLPTADLTNPPSGQFFYGFPSDLGLPRTWQWNVAVEQGLGRGQTISVSYVAALGQDLLYGQLFNNLGPQKYRVTYTTNSGSSNYQAMQVQFHRRVRAGLIATASYTWSHSMDTSSADVTALPPDNLLDDRSNHGPSDFDIRQNFTAALSYNVPRLNRKWLRPLTEGWGLDSIVAARSALPVDITYSQNIGFGTFPLRADAVKGVPLYLNDPNVAGGRRINPAAFAISTTRQGDLGRNALRGFNLVQADLSARRTFRLHEKLRLMFRADLFNVLNHPNFANFINDLGSGLFGQSTSTANSQIGGGASYGLNSIFQVGGPRSVQLSLKLLF